MLFPRDQLEAEIHQLTLAGSEVLTRIRRSLDAVGPSLARVPFYTRSRVKSPDSLRSKLLHKYGVRQTASGTQYYYLSDITDVVGFRLVTLYDEELAQAINIVLDTLSRCTGLTQPIFPGTTHWDSITQAAFYTRANLRHGDVDRYAECHQYILKDLETCVAKGLVTESRKAWIKEHVVKPPDSRPTAYSSTHILADAISYSLGREIKVSVEFQIRTAVEDIWGEVNHDTIYKAKHPYIWTTRLEDLYEQLDRDSRALKTPIENIPNTIADIRDHSKAAHQCVKDILTARNSFSIPMSLIDASGSNYIDDTFQGVIDEYKVLIERLALLIDSSTIADITAMLDRCINAVERLSDSTRRLRPGTPQKLKLNIRRLCALERLRLESLSNNVAHRDAANGMDYKNAATALFLRVKALEGKPGWLMKPPTVFRYLEYFLCRVFDAANAIDMLNDVYLTMRNDDTLAPLSIYRAIIPRDLAVHFGASAINLWDATHISGNGLGDSVDQVGNYLLKAVSFATECIKIIAVDYSRRGDILFGAYEENQKSIDAERMIKIYAITIEYFKSDLFKATKLEPSDLERVVDLGYRAGIPPESIPFAKVREFCESLWINRP